MQFLISYQNKLVVAIQQSFLEFEFHFYDGKATFNTNQTSISMTASTCSLLIGCQ